MSGIEEKKKKKKKKRKKNISRIKAIEVTFDQKLS